MTETQSDILIERHDGWACVVLNRPQRRNAMTAPMMQRLAQALLALGADTTVAAVVLRGAAGAFCSGIDLTELQKDGPESGAAEALRDGVRAAHLAIFHCPCPVIVALERYAINGGCGLAVSGDLIVAGEGAFLQIGEIQQGARIPMNAAWLRLKLSETVLARMAYLGDRVPAPELLRLGVVHEVVPDAQVIERAAAMAQRIAGFPAGSSRQIKTDVRRPFPMDPEQWFSMQASGTLLSAAQVRQ